MMPVSFQTASRFGPRRDGQQDRQAKRSNQTSHRAIRLKKLSATHGQAHALSLTDSPLDCEVKSPA